MAKEHDDVYKFLLELLKKRFPDEPIKQDNIHLGHKSYNFPCPYCGDSKKDPKKKRGHIYHKTKTFKCWNDGCGRFATLQDFIKFWTDAYFIDIMDMEFDYEPEFDPYSFKNKIDKSKPLHNTLREMGILNGLMKKYQIERAFSLTPIDRVDVDSYAYEYAQERCLLDIPGIGDYMYANNYDNKIFIINYDKSTDAVIGFSIRHLDERQIKKHKYDNFTYSRIMEYMNVTEEIENLDIIDTLSNYFNIFNVDFNSKVTVLEGQIDSLFVKNAIAVTGTTKLDFILAYLRKNDIKILFDNDVAGKKESVGTIDQGIYTFLWEILIKRLTNMYKDKPAILKINDINNLYTYLKGKGPINYDKFNALLDKYFSNSAFDLWYV